MAQPYLLTRTLDPLFALFIGSTSAWLRIRREEVERAVVLASTTNPSSPTPILTSTRGSETVERDNVNRLGEVGTADNKATVKVPSNLDTWNEVVRRIGNIKLREVDVRDLWRKRDAWGTYEPNAVVVEKRERERKGE